ncbi:TPA: hypothetical protein N0F65_000053 [Lagenidium giganteum]|uniref:Uncharacterized protein n=1 Tax=Lagenidium giganteum TaxID=4803 RepID=A0AAV2YRV1_9STRA|nr:TPA: hypothetical protein N0F65_000053 [Lagenidium giganteum]
MDVIGRVNANSPSCYCNITFIACQSWSLLTFLLPCFCSTIVRLTSACLITHYINQWQPQCYISSNPLPTKAC